MPWDKLFDSPASTMLTPGRKVWLAGRGWLRLDPTAAVAPDRIEQGLLDSLDFEDRALIDASPLPAFAWIKRLLSQWGQRQLPLAALGAQLR